MPTYDYKCTSCGKTFEFFHAMTAKPRKKCPGCGKNALEKLIGSGAGIIFKGSGFYQTDYRSKAYSSAQAAAKKESADKPAAAAPASTAGSSSTPAAPTSAGSSSPSAAPASQAASSTAPAAASRPQRARSDSAKR